MDPLNIIRQREGLPCYSDNDHVTEFTPESLEAALTATGWHLREMITRGGVSLAVADSP